MRQPSRGGAWISPSVLARAGWHFREGMICASVTSVLLQRPLWVQSESKWSPVDAERLGGCQKALEAEKRAF